MYIVTQIDSVELVYGEDFCSIWINAYYTVGTYNNIILLLARIIH